MVGMATTSIEKGWLNVNDALCDSLGYSREELMRMTWVKLTYLEDVAPDLAQFNRLLSGEINNYALNKRFIHKDGRLVYTRMMVSCVRKNDGTVDYVVALVEDITAQKQSEAALKDSEAKLRTIYESTSEAVMLLDENGFLDCNKATLDLFGCASKDEFCSKPPAELSPLLQPCGTDSMTLANQYITQAMQSGREFFEWSHKTIDTNQPFFADVLFTAMDLNGKKVIQAVVRNVTERKQSELREKSRVHVLELITNGEHLPAILEAIVRGVELENPAMLCSILLLDDAGKHLLSGAAPSLPDFYNEAIHGIEIGVGVGCCGTAAFTNERVIVDDIQSHPYWTPYKELASKAGLGACWSEPIRSTQGKVLGTFAIYLHNIHQPTEANIALIEQTASLASIAIEKIQTDLILKSSQERWAFAIEGAGDGVWDWNIQTDQATYSKRWKEMLGYAEDEIIPINQEWVDRIHPEDREVVSATMQAYLEGGLPIYVVTYRLRCKDDSYKWILGRGMVVSRDDNNRPLRMVGTHTDITTLKQAEEKLKLAATVFTHAREGIMITDATGSIIEVNDTFTEITSYSREEAIGQNPRMLKSGHQSPEFYAEMWKSLLEKSHWYGEVWNRRKSGEVYAELLTISAVLDNAGQVQNYVALFTDITQMKEHQGQLEHIAHYDPLTNLPNRVLLADRLSQAIVQCQRHHQSLAVAFLDLDGFKAVNDAHGHDVGDELLITISQRMKEALREGDTLARIGGDEFVAVLADLAKVEDCQPVLERLLQAAADPVIVGEIALNVTASIGVAIYPQDNADADMLIRHADQAMYVAKQAGKNRYHLFDTAQDDAVKIQRESIGDIRSALDRCEFVLHYQPKVNMHTGDMIGVEALIRWQHPVRGLVPPLSFLPVIEGHAISLDLGEWVIDTALIQISQWQSMGLNLPVSVNIAAYQLQQANFVSRLAELLATHPEVSPRDLELEILETSALSDVMQVSATMQACLGLGVHFALDDFGAGYSSLTHLRRLPAKLIKIDQSFVRDMLTDPDDLAIVEGIVGLAKSFQREVIAEGVETIAHGVALLQMGCDLAQGYGIARPMPASDIPAWANNWRPDDSWSARSLI